MTTPRCSIRLLPVICLLVVVWSIAAANALAAVPSAAPTTAPAMTATLQNGIISYVIPSGTWVFADKSSNDTRAAYVDHAGLAILALQVLPADAQIDRAAATALCGQLKVAHKKRNDDVIQEPTIETDKRFAIRIHEIYKHDGQLADELHLYRKTGAFALMLTVNAASDDAGPITAAQAVAEQMLLSVKVNKPTKTRPSKSP